MNLVSKCVFLGFAGLLATAAALAQSQTGSSAEQTSAVIATVNGSPILTSEIEGYLASQLHSLRQNIYNLQRNMIETLLNKMVIEQESKRRGTTPDEFRSAVTAAITVDPQEIQDAYARAANRAPLGIPSDLELKEQIRTTLMAQKRAEAFRKVVADLRTAAVTEIFLQPPTPLRVAVGPAGPSKGNRQAALTVVEFADFECPYCRQMTGTLKQVLAEYGDNVRFVYRHFPLASHKNAFKAAQASVCAEKQGKFWEYHDLLFDSQLATADFEKLAESLSLDTKAFKACLLSDGSRDVVMSDMKEAATVGVSSTPTFFINGLMVRGAVGADQLRKVLDEELKQTEKAVTQ